MMQVKTSERRKMALPHLRPDYHDDPQPALITFLRLSALECRAARRSSIQVCMLLDPEADAVDYATVLARTLPEMLLRRPIFWRPGTLSRSFDEEWLLALARAIRTGDRDSERFLLARRARPGASSALRLMLGGLMKRLDIL